MKPSFRAAALLAAVLSLPALAASTISAGAQSYRHMSCYQLWYQRNAIYASEGYCFKTARARAVFGRACFPPYGELTPDEHDEVAEIERWEHIKGCR